MNYHYLFHLKLIIYIGIALLFSPLIVSFKTCKVTNSCIMSTKYLHIST